MFFNPIKPKKTASLWVKKSPYPQQASKSYQAANDSQAPSPQMRPACCSLGLVAMTGASTFGVSRALQHRWKACPWRTKVRQPRGTARHPTCFFDASHESKDSLVKKLCWPFLLKQTGGIGNWRVGMMATALFLG